MSSSSLPDARYRVDKFAVPAESREEFLRIIAQTHSVLRLSEGFLGDFILEQESGPGEFNIVTFVQWAGPEAIAGASASVRKLHADMGIDPREVVARLGIRPDIAIYRQVEA